MRFIYDILHFGWQKYLDEHNLQAKITMDKEDEVADGFFRN